MRARAVVQVTLEIPARSHWGDACQLEQVRKQAVEDVLGQLRKGVVVDVMTPAIVVGIPVVRTIIVIEDAP